MIPPAPASIGRQFQSSDELLNRVWDFTLYSQLTTNLDVFTDSNTRQRSPVCAEALLASNLQQAAAGYDTLMSTYTTQYHLNQLPGGAKWAEWQALLISNVHALYRASGDLSLFRQHYDVLKRYLEVELISNSTGLWECVGSEWSCSKPEIDWPNRNGFVFTPTDTVLNAWTYGALREFAELAIALGGRDEDVQMVTQLGDMLRGAMNKQLYSESAGAYVDGLETNHSTIYASSFSAAKNVPWADQPVWATLLDSITPDGGMITGPYPSMHLAEALFANTSDHGQAGVGKMLLNKGTGSWHHQMTVYNATTTMEAWTTELKENLTFSHPWMAFPLQIIMRWVAGIRALVPGFAKVLIQPQPGPVLNGSAVLPTRRGPIGVSWWQELTGQVIDAFALRVTLPGAVTGRACLPLNPCVASVGKKQSATSVPVSVDGKHALGVIDGDYACVDGLTSGEHVLACPV